MRKIIVFILVWTAIYAVFSIPLVILLGTDPFIIAPFYTGAIAISFVISYLLIYRGYSQ